MSYGIHREALEYTLGQFQLRYGGGMSEQQFIDLRLATPPEWGSRLLMSNVVETPNSNASVYSDSTKLITRLEFLNYTPDTVAAFSFGSGRFLYVPYGAYISIPMADHFGIDGYDAGCTGTAQCLVLVYGYQPALQVT